MNHTCPLCLTNPKAKNISVNPYIPLILYFEHISLSCKILKKYFEENGWGSYPDFLLRSFKIFFDNSSQKGISKK